MSYNDFKQQYQLNPIVLTGGNLPGGMVPIISLTEGNTFDTGLLSSGSDLNPDDFFAHFTPLPDATLVDNDVGTYTFANQNVAANAIIGNALKISLRMDCPVRDPGGYATKLAVMSALKSSLDQHNFSGGTYTVATPSYIYTNCILLGLRDISSGESKQAQTAWQWDFYRPLLTLDEAEAAQNNAMSKITAQTPWNSQPAWSGLEPTVGQPPSLAGPSIVPAASGAAAAGVATGTSQRSTGTDRVSQ